VLEWLIGKPEIYIGQLHTQRWFFLFRGIGHSCTEGS